MRPTLIIIAAATGCAALPILSGPAWAQANRTFVSGHGSDANPCSLAAPCRSFAQALSQTNASGEITVLDSAGYGTVSITRSVTITNPGGVEAGITTTSGQTAITIDTPAPATITLRGLTLEGGEVGANGILVNSTIPASGTVDTLNIIDCVVKDFTVNGIAIEPTFAGSGGVPTMNILIAGSYSLNNDASGIEMTPNTVILNSTIYQTTLSGNGTGLTTGGGGGAVNVVFVDSHADSNIVTGISNSTGTIVMKHSTATLSGTITNADVINSGALDLWDRNTIGALNNNPGSATTDGTNNILVIGNPLSKINPQ